MWQRMFSGASLLDLPVVVMFGFIALFIAVLIWTHLRRRTSHYTQMASMPLDLGDDTQASPPASRDSYHD